MSHTHWFRRLGFNKHRQKLNNPEVNIGIPVHPKSSITQYTTRLLAGREQMISNLLKGRRRATKKNKKTYYYTDCLTGILIMVYYMFIIIHGVCFF